MVEGECHFQGGAYTGGALQGDPAAERFDPVFESDKARAAGEVGAAAPVITHADAQEALGGLDFDVDDGGVRVLGRVGQGLGHDVVGGDLDRFGQPSLHADVQLDRDGGATGERFHRRTQAALDKDRRVDAARHLTRLVQHACQLDGHVLQLV